MVFSSKVGQNADKGWLLSLDLCGELSTEKQTSLNTGYIQCRRKYGEMIEEMGYTLLCVVCILILVGENIWYVYKYGRLTGKSWPITENNLETLVLIFGNLIF